MSGVNDKDYYDSQRELSEQFFNRDLPYYINELFPDDPVSKQFGYMYEASFFKNNHGTLLQERVDDPDRLELIYGGVDGFFTPDTHILDIGSGGGQAVSQIEEKYKSRGIHVFGLDKRYASHDQHPVYQNSNYVAALWTALPFEENTFDRLLAFESFPRYMTVGRPSISELNARFAEVNRGAKPNALWRGTFIDRVNNDYPPTAELLANNGWEVYETSQITFAAKLNK